MTADPRIPHADHCVLRYLLDRRAADKPDKTFVVLQDGTEISYRRLRELTVRVAAGFQSLGVRQGDNVSCWMPNSLQALLAWFGLNYIGAVYCPVHTAYKGSILQHVLNTTGARLIVLHPDLAGRLSEVDVPSLEHVVVCGAPPPGLRWPSSTFDELSTRAAEIEPLQRSIQPWDTQSIIFTSGTTGPSKGVLSSYLQLYTMGGPIGFPYLGAHDRMLVNLPLFHVGGTCFVYGMLVFGGSIALVESFSTDAFWDTVRATQSTATLLLGVMATFLLKQPASDADRQHGLRCVCMVPLSNESLVFTERFGVDVYTCFNMTETNMPIISERNPRLTGTCGKVRNGVQVRLVDENDCEVPVGGVGEMMIRADAPWSLNHGYFANPEATAKAWRNGWFHTGDAFRRDGDGNYFFVDRVKDAIRRRGENISSFEVEAAVCAHPSVREAAAVPVKSDLSEDEILIVVAPSPRQIIDPRVLIDFLVPRVAHFMVPRFVRVVEDLPKTPTAKILKTQLRAEGITPDTWDRESAGVRLARERLGSSS